jgi:hypothetical protein
MARPSALIPVSYAIPGHYIVGYSTVAKVCTDMTGMAWANWLTYAVAIVGNEWIITSNSSKLCTYAAKAAHALIPTITSFHDGGASHSKRDQQGYALLAGLAKGNMDKRIIHGNLPAGWKCFALQSLWGLMAWNYAVQSNVGQPGDDQWAPASGPNAGAGYCESGGTLVAPGAWKGGRFFTWAPDTRTCKAHYKLKDEPDPNHSGDVIHKSYAEANFFADYDRISC